MPATDSRTARASIRRRTGRSRPADDDLQLLPLLRGAVRGVPGDGDAPRLRRRRPQLPRQSLPRLRRLLRRLPVLAAARIQRQRAADAGAGAGRVLRRLCLAARARPACSRATGWRSASVAALSRGRVHPRLRRLARPGGAVRRPHRAGRVLPADAAQRDGGTVRRGVSLRDRRAASWACAPSGATSANRAATLADPGSLWQAVRDAGNAALSRWRRRRLLQRGRAADRPAPALSPLHVLRLPALLRLDLRGDALSLSAWAARRPMPGTICRWCSARSAASASSSARSACWHAKLRRDPALMDRASLGMDMAFLVMLFLTSLTGLALLVLRETAAMGAAARAASRRGVRAVPHHALRQVRARPLPLRRAGALCEGAAVAGRQARIALSCRRATPPGSSRASAER